MGGSEIIFCAYFRHCLRPLCSTLSTWFIISIRSLGFSGECLGQHAGSDQAANLGDGNGACELVSFVLLHSWHGLDVTCELIIHFLWCVVNETGVIRWNYGDAQLGACKETIQGGNHFRYWVQNGPNGNRSVFLKPNRVGERCELT